MAGLGERRQDALDAGALTQDVVDAGVEGRSTGSLRRRTRRKSSSNFQNARMSRNSCALVSSARPAVLAIAQLGLEEGMLFS
jgi:hypothetical protein